VDESSAIYEHALKLWEGLPAELDYDFLFSQRGVLNLAHTLQDVRESMRRVYANQLNGVDGEWLDAAEVHKICPILNVSPEVRYPVLGGTWQPRAGIVKHDHVAWAFARKADSYGVDLIQNCEVTGFLRSGDRVVGWKPAWGGSGPGGLAWPPPGTPACWRIPSGCGCRSRATRCRRWSPSCSSRCTRPW